MNGKGRTSEDLYTKTPLGIQQVVIWGHKLYSHTHSYIHYAFHKAFLHLGYKTYWVRKLAELDGIDLSGTLFLTEGQVDDELPVRYDCWYVLHNCHHPKYGPLIDAHRVLLLQKYTYECKNYVLEQLEPYIFFSDEHKTLYMPWATDLLPHEIHEMKGKLIPFQQRKKRAVWVGTVGDQLYGNVHQLAPFVSACKQYQCRWFRREVIAAEENRNLVCEALLAPAIVGAWQRENGYIPCRIFKNISYGAIGATNSEAAYDLFEGKILYNSDTAQLCTDMVTFAQEHDISDLHALMDIVRDRHTYINRINHILTCLIRIAYA